MEVRDNAKYFRREILIRLIRSFLKNRLVLDVDKIPVEILPTRQAAYRCCIYKELAILRTRCLAALGLGFLILAPLNIDRGVAYVLAPLAVIMVLPLYTAVCKWLESHHGTSRIAQTVAITSITYLAVQNYLIGIIKMVVARVFGEGVLDDNILLKVVVALIVMAVLYPIALFIERYAPWMLGKKRSSAKA